MVSEVSDLLKLILDRYRLIVFVVSKNMLTASACDIFTQPLANLQLRAVSNKLNDLLLRSRRKPFNPCASWSQQWTLYSCVRVSTIVLQYKKIAINFGDIYWNSCTHDRYYYCKPVSDGFSVACFDCFLFFSTIQRDCFRCGFWCVRTKFYVSVAVWICMLI